ncbi:MAG: hypothetical protein HKP60_03590 [Eudoraea sp.]|nr:hypothetical protein [Eudoraea sp.]
MAFVLLAPRIPQVYYGTEILMENSSIPESHGLIRSDFPGGWESDKANAFSGSGLTPEQLDMQEFMRELLHFRKGEPAIHRGKTKHFAPEDGIYVLFRYERERKVVLILNKNEQPVDLDLSRFREMALEGQEFHELLSGEEFVWDARLKLGNKGVLILTNKKQ